jgi:hypothetical protein
VLRAGRLKAAEQMESAIICRKGLFHRKYSITAIDCDRDKRIQTGLQADPNSMYN